MIYGNKLQPITYQDEFTEFIKSLDIIQPQPINEFKINFSFRDIGKLIIRMIKEFIRLIDKFWKRCMEVIKSKISERSLKEAEIIDFYDPDKLKAKLYNDNNTIIGVRDKFVVINGIDYMKEVMDIELNLTLSPFMKFFDSLVSKYDNILNRSTEPSINRAGRNIELRRFESGFDYLAENYKDQIMLEWQKESIININPIIKRTLMSSSTLSTFNAIINAYEDIWPHYITNISKERFNREYRLKDLYKASDNITNMLGKLEREEGRCSDTIDKTMKEMDDKSKRILNMLNPNSEFYKVSMETLNETNRSISENIFGFCKDIMLEYTKFGKAILSIAQLFYNNAIQQYIYCHLAFQKIK